MQIILHTPDEMPQVSKLYLKIPIDHEVAVTVKPYMITTSDALKHVSPKKYINKYPRYLF